jgi:serine/threonine protein kinase
LVFEFVEHDLHGIFDSSIKFDAPHVKCLMKQLLEGMLYMHDRGYMHRDIKGGNILLNKHGVLKIADFGLARVLLPHTGTSAHYTSKVVTLWYRAPELLLGMTNYSPAIDLWSIGCFFTELLTSKPLLPGKDEA